MYIHKMRNIRWQKLRETAEEEQTLDGGNGEQTIKVKCDSETLMDHSTMSEQTADKDAFRPSAQHCSVHYKRKISAFLQVVYQFLATETFKRQGYVWVTCTTETAYWRKNENKYPALSNSRTDLAHPPALLDTAIAKNQQMTYTVTTNTSPVLWDWRRNKRKILRSTCI